ncbi:MAG: hypothetical protein Q4E17_01240 [Synergistes sp.]|nr:hypothetical protein [Synergistes sp.]
MTKNVKILLSLFVIATAVMLGVIFTAATEPTVIGNTGDLVAGSANHTMFRLSDDIKISADSTDYSILNAVKDNYTKPVSLDLNGTDIVIDDGMSSDVPLLKPVSMADMTVTDCSSENLSDQNGAIVMGKPLYGENSSDKVLKANITLSKVFYENKDGIKPMFMGNASYDVKVNFVTAKVAAPQLVQEGAGQGYTFFVSGDALVYASLDNVEIKNLKANNGAQFSDQQINAFLGDDQIAVRSNDLWVVKNAVAAVENAEQLRTALARHDIKTVVISGDEIVVSENLIVRGYKILNLGGKTNYPLALNNAAFVLSNDAIFEVQNGEIAIASGNEPMFALKDDAILTVAGDVRLRATETFNYIALAGDDYDAVMFENGAKLWFDNDRSAAHAFEEDFLWEHENESATSSIGAVNNEAQRQYIEGPDADGYRTVTNKKPK